MKIIGFITNIPDSPSTLHSPPFQLLPIPSLSLAGPQYCHELSTKCNQKNKGPQLLFKRKVRNKPRTPTNSCSTAIWLQLSEPANYTTLHATTTYLWGCFTYHRVITAVRNKLLT